MGNFHGHAIPGTLMILLGLFYFLRSLKVSFCRGLRTRQFWISFEALSFAFYGGLGAIAEFLDALIPNANFSESHLDHIHVTSALCVVGIIELLHLYKVLENPAWGLVMPGGLVFVATLFTAHPQAYDLESFAHAFTAFLFWVTAISRALEIFAGMYLNQAYLRRLQVRSATWRRKGGKPFSRNYYLMDIPRVLCCCFSPRVRDAKEEEEEVQLGLNPGYFNPIIYTTPFPLLSAASMFFNGVWWWEMAVAFFSNEGKDIPESEKMNPMATHYAYSHQIFPHFVWVSFFLVFVTIAAKFIDRRYFLNDNQHYEFSEESDEVELARLGSHPSLNSLGGNHDEYEEDARV